MPCNTCELCLAGAHTACHTLHTTNFDPGGFSEYLRVPALQTERGVLVLPDDVSYEDGTFVEPLGCVVRAQAQPASGPALRCWSSAAASRACSTSGSPWRSAPGASWPPT